MVTPYEKWRIEIDYGPPDAAVPNYLDVTSYVDSIVGPIDFQFGDSAETSGEPATLAVILNNPDQRFTPGNPLAPTTALKSSMRIRFSESVGYFTYWHMTGYIEFPEIESWQGGSTTAPRDGTITISAVDLIARLDRDPPFLSNLAAHITTEGVNNGLIAYYPLSETGPDFLPLVNSGDWPILSQLPIGSASITTPNGAASLNPNAGTLGGDDLSVLEFSTSFTTDTPATRIAGFDLYAADVSTPVLGDALALVAWVNPSMDAPDAQWRPINLTFVQAPRGGVIRIRRTDSTETPAGVWKAEFTDTASLAWTSNAFAKNCATGKATLVAIRIHGASNTMSLFVDNDEFVATTTGTMTIFDTTSVALGAVYSGLMGHFQVYHGPDATTYGIADHRAQFAAGINALAGQTTGERIATIADYAGLPTYLRAIDPGVTRMQAVSLAGKTPAAAMLAAADTDRGKLFADGEGRLTFYDRRRLLNI